MRTAGIVYVAYGRASQLEAEASIETLKQWCNLPIVVVGDRHVRGGKLVKFRNRGTPGRWAKVNLNNLSPFQDTLFLDADTRIHGPLDVGFQALEAGWDLAMVPSAPQGSDCLAHLSPLERKATFDEVGGYPLQLNTGVMWFRRSARLDAMFEAWRNEWGRWRDKDQGALLRALQRVPLRIWLMGYPFNDRMGQVVEHRFGMATA